MKTKSTYFILFSLLFLHLSSSAFIVTDTIINKSKKNTPSKNRIYNPPLVLKTSPTAFLFGAIIPLCTSEYRVMVEISSGKRSSEQMGVSILGKSFIYKLAEKAYGVSVSDVLKVSGWRVQYAHKFYLVGRRHYAPYGFYWGPDFSYADTRISLGLNRYYQQVYFDLHHFNANIIIGVQMGKMDRLTLDLYTGAGYRSNKAFYHTPSALLQPLDGTKYFGDWYATHLNIVAGLNMGYSF